MSFMDCNCFARYEISIRHHPFKTAQCHNGGSHNSLGLSGLIRVHSVGFGLLSEQGAEYIQSVIRRTYSFSISKKSGKAGEHD